MNATEYDTFTSGLPDTSKWQILQLPMGDGGKWSYGDAEAKVKAENGTIEITVNPFRLKHDQIHMFDDPKHLIVSPQPIEVAEQGTTRVSCEMACESYNGNSDDLLDIGRNFLHLALIHSRLRKLLWEGAGIIGAKHEHWCRVAWENRSTSDFFHQHLVNWHPFVRLA